MTRGWKIALFIKTLGWTGGEQHKPLTYHPKEVVNRIAHSRGTPSRSIEVPFFGAFYEASLPRGFLEETRN